jgi:ADP-heptose:LPS heptosyltransferase
MLKSLVLTHPARLGDSVMALPLHRAAAQTRQIASNVGAPYRFFFGLAGIEVADSGPLYPKGARALLRASKELRSQAYDEVFLVRPNFRSALLCALAGIKRRIGDATEGRGLLLTHKAEVPLKANQLVRLQAFGQAAGFEVPNDFGLPSATKLDPPVVGLAPGASYSDKLIPPMALLEVGERLLRAGYRIALLGGPGEERWAEPLGNLEAENWIGRYSLPELIAPLSSLAAMIGADGGLYHLSVACGVPSVGVYGETTKRYWWHDWGPHTPVLAADDDTRNVTADQLWAAVSRSLSLPTPATAE